MIKVSDYAEGLIEISKGLWTNPNNSKIHYPDDGHMANASVEETSFWFRHRKDCVTTAVRNFPPTGLIFDAGGGNGSMTRALEKSGFSAVLVEPHPDGVQNAKSAGVAVIVNSKMEDVRFRSKSIPAIGAFDVLEHIEDDRLFLRQMHNLLVPNGHLYLTVPAYSALWSEEDKWAEHFRRYRKGQLEKLVIEAGYTISYSTYFFSYLVAPIFFARTLPSLLKIKRNNLDQYKKEHTSQGFVSSGVSFLNQLELSRIIKKESILFGSSLLVVARPY